MALPQRKQSNEQPQNIYQYQVRNAQKFDRRSLVSDVGEDPRLLSSENPTLREQQERAAKTPANDPQYNAPQPTAPSRASTAAKAVIRKKILNRKTATKVLKRVKVKFVTASIIAWGMTLWSIQVVFALVSTIFLGLLGASSAVVNSNIITRGLGWVAERATEAATWVISGTAISISDMTAGMFMAMYVITFAIGMITLMAASIQYMMSLIHPLSGEQMGMKYGAFLIAILGYATPLLNLFPWFLVFAVVVWKYPR